MQAMLASARRSGMVRTLARGGEPARADLPSGRAFDRPDAKLPPKPRGQGGVQVKRSVDRWSRLALVAAMTAALALAACGRKGPLDPPPSAGITPPPASAPRSSLGEENYGPLSRPASERPQTAAVAPPPAAPPPPPKTFPLDFLLAK
jgi:predicted small lipoprotein YifL